MALINYITQIQIDFGAVRLLNQECERIGIRRPIVVTDAGVRAAGVLGQVLSHLGVERDFVVFDSTPSNPTERAIREAVTLYIEHRCDGIIAVGGGSSIDLAKGVAICATHEGPLKYFAAIEGGLARITSVTAPIIAVPTTAGTGSEVGRGTWRRRRTGNRFNDSPPRSTDRLARDRRVIRNIATCCVRCTARPLPQHKSTHS